MFYFLLIFYFLKSSLTFNINDQCSIRDSCTNASKLSPRIYNDELVIQSRNCFCDSVCEQYGDCCSNSNISDNKYECVDYLLPTINSKNVPFNRLSVWMRSECLSIYIGSSIDIQCRNLNKQLFNDNPILFIPVTSLQTNITYKNYYCAYCNNDLNTKNLEFWEYKTFCYEAGNNNDDYLTLNSDEQVQYYIYNLTKDCSKTILYPYKRGSTEPSVFIRPCKKSLPSICPLNTSNELIQNCSSFGTAYRYIKNSNKIYQNFYCAQCNHPDNIEDITCLDPYLSSATPPMTLIRTYPLSILFDPNLLKNYLNNNTIPRSIYSINYSCEKSTELYDLFEKKCIEITNRNQEFIISMKCSYPMQTNLQLNQTIFYNNGSLELLDQSIFLTQDDYVILNDNRIIFCADQWLTKTNLPEFSLYRNILSIICTSISLGCLLLFMIIYFLIPFLHNLPGKCLLFLSLSLFIGQLVFISTSNLTKTNSFCFVSAILIHYFYLSSFSWLLIISIQIYLTFNQQILFEDKHETKNFRLFLYNILVWLSCGIVILIAGLIQLYKPTSDYSPGYGEIFCSISKVNSMIIFFLAPIGCILLIVTILFIKTLLTIYHSHNVAKLAHVTSSSNKKDRNLVFVYARLASLMGIQWILLLAALIMRQTWLWILFEIINSLPGLFICLGFLCSKRILNNLKQKFSIKLIKRRQSLPSNTTTSTILTTPPVLATNSIKNKIHF